MTGKARQIRQKAVSETVSVSVDCAGELDSGETITGSPTAVATGLTFNTPTVNTGVLTINGRSVAIGEAIQFQVSGGTAGTDYSILLTFSTTGSQTRNARVIMRVDSD